MNILMRGYHPFRPDVFPFLVKFLKDDQKNWVFRSLFGGLHNVLVSHNQVFDVGFLPDLFFSGPRDLTQEGLTGFRACVDYWHS